jgi:catechol 2,3-dioxygenase-like lactoylglutathione lyase family enzyme
MGYKIPAKTKIGHVHLKVSNLERALTFYRDLLGFEITQWYGSSAVFLSAGGYYHHIGLNTCYSKEFLLLRCSPGAFSFSYLISIKKRSCSCSETFV